MEGYSNAFRKETDEGPFSTRPLNNVSHGTSRMLPDSAFRVFLKNNRRNYSSAENIPEQSSAMRSEVFGTCPHCCKFNTNYAFCQSCDPLKLKEGWNCDNEAIDKFIKETQSNANSYHGDYLEWISFDQFKDVEKIGQGGFGAVYSALWMDGLREVKVVNGVPEKSRSQSITVALKTIPEEVNEDFLNEMRLHYATDDSLSYCIKLYGITYDSTLKTYMTVNQYCNSGDLRSFLKSNFEHLKWENKIRILYQISSGLHFIHDWAKLIHRDFHPGNILVENNLKNEKKIFISDFGLTYDNLPQAKKPVEGIYGILPYVAPEILNKEQHIKAASDVYSFGMVMIELSSGQLPFGDCAHNQQLIIKILCLKARPKCAKGTPECYLNMVNKCLDANPDERPTIIEINSQINNWLNCLVNDQTSLSEQEIEIRKQFEEADKFITEIAKSSYDTVHPESVYKSRFYTLPSTQNSKIPSVSEDKIKQNNIELDFDDYDD